MAWKKNGWGNNKIKENGVNSIFWTANQEVWASFPYLVPDLDLLQSNNGHIIISFCITHEVGNILQDGLVYTGVRLRRRFVENA